MIQALWSGDQSVSYHGQVVSFESVSGSAPLQSSGPPIWVGGASESALLRTVRYGQAWHPIIRAGRCAKPARPGAHRRKGKDGLAFCPRMPRPARYARAGRPPTRGRHAGPGARGPGSAGAELGAEHVNLDWFTGDLDATRDHERGWQMLALLAEKALDLKNETPLVAMTIELSRSTPLLRRSGTPLWADLGAGEEGRFVVEHSNWPTTLRCGSTSPLPCLLNYRISPRSDDCEVAATIEPMSRRYKRLPTADLRPPAPQLRDALGTGPRQPEAVARRRSGRLGCVIFGADR